MCAGSLRYDLDEALPDHSSLTRIRERYGLEVFRCFFEAIVEQCQAAGLIWGRELYFDGTKVAANAGKESVKPRFAKVAANAGKESVKPRFAVEAHLSNLFGLEADESGDEEPQQQAAEKTPTHEPEELPATRALRISLPPEEYAQLAQCNEARHDWIEQEGAQDRSVKGRNYQRIADYQVSTTDPDATIMRNKGGVDLGYHTHYVVDGGRARIIVAALVTPKARDGQPTHARLTVADPLSLEAVAATGRL